MATDDPTKSYLLHCMGFGLGRSYIVLDGLALEQPRIEHLCKLWYTNRGKICQGNEIP